MCKDGFIDVNAMTDEELDEMYAFRKTNGLKSAAPLYVYLVLQAHSNARRHLTQPQILRYLEEEYDVTLERKALSRWLHLLLVLDLGVYYNPRCGAWMEK